MTDHAPEGITPVAKPIESLEDPRAIQILTTEHQSLLSYRSLAYNEAFTRGEMFLGFLSFSFVALALLAQAIPVEALLPVAALVLAFDLVVGLTTYGRIIGANYEDYRWTYGMARIRHGYVEVAPVVGPYITTSRHDDITGVMVSYGSPPTRGFAAILYGLTTSPGMIGLIVAMIGGALALSVSLVVGLELWLAFVIGAVVAPVVLVLLVAATLRYYEQVQNSLEVMFPTPPDEAPNR